MDLPYEEECVDSGTNQKYPSCMCSVCVKCQCSTCENLTYHSNHQGMLYGSCSCNGATCYPNNNECSWGQLYATCCEEYEPRIVPSV